MADAADRKEEAQLPTPGYAVHLAIPSINLDTVVKQGGAVLDRSSRNPCGRRCPLWQTLPFVAVHYGDLTALVGAGGNCRDRRT